MDNKAYKKTEKWWLGLTVLFLMLFNLPGVPPYYDSKGALWHGALILIPLWITIYVGFFKVNQQRKLREAPEEYMKTNSDISDEEGQ